MKLSLLFPSAALGIVLLAAACTTETGNRQYGATPEGPVHIKDGVIVPPTTETKPNEDAKIESEIVFDAGAVFAARDCAVTVTYKPAPGQAPPSRVRIAGEFSSPAWLEGAQELTRNGDEWSVKIAPSATALALQLYGYKLILDDSNWILDPKNKYRKIVGDQMNSALKLPNCGGGPEIRAGKVDVSADGQMSVHVEVLSASDGDVAERVRASFDGVPVVAENVSIDKATGSLDFKYTKLEKGKHSLTLRAVDKKGRESDAVDLPFWVESEPFDYRDGLLYMLLIDRFANGDTTNDAPVNGPVHYDADWHGGDLQGALKVMQAGYFESIGVRTIWLSPLNEQTSNYHKGDGNQNYSAYHGYWPVKARSTEPRFGGDAALKAFVQEAHKRGIRVLLDLINNQVHQDHEYVKTNADWFRTDCQCGTEGCGWSDRPFDCVFQPYLPDINWNQIGAERKFTADAINWIAKYDLDGFRVDAVKHVEANSVFNMRAELARRFEQGGARIYMVGEIAVGPDESKTFFGQTFKNGYDWLNAYTGETALDGQFDFPTRNAMADGLVKGDAGFDSAEYWVKRSETDYVPGNLNVRFLNGHDNTRIASLAAQDWDHLNCAWRDGCRDEQLPPLAYSDPVVYERLKRALTVLLTLPGVPYLYQGDEVAFGGGGDPDMRRNMLFDGAGDGLTNLEMAKPGAAPPVLTAQQQDLRAWVQKLGKTRAASRALRRGERKTILATADLWVYGWVTDDDVAVVAVNRGAAVGGQTIDLGQVGGNANWKSALGTGKLAGNKLTLGAGEAAIFTR